MKPVLPVLIAAAALLGCDARRPVQPATEANAMSNVIHLTTPAFPALKAEPRPVLIDFWAPWCGPCRQQGPILDQLSLTVKDQAVIAKVNVDEERDLATQFGVQAIPTLVVLKQGQVVQRFVGVQGAETLAAALKAAN